MSKSGKIVNLRQVLGDNQATQLTPLPAALRIDESLSRREIEVEGCLLCPPGKEFDTRRQEIRIKVECGLIRTLEAALCGDHTDVLQLLAKIIYLHSGVEVSDKVSAVINTRWGKSAAIKKFQKELSALLQ